MDALNAFLRVQRRSKFQEALFGSWLLYSQHSLAPSLTERTVYVFAALESLLLRDNSEPILASVPDRMAYISADDKAARRAIVGRFKEAYKHRSSIVHHGRAHLDESVKKTLQEFLVDVWIFYRALFRQHDQFATRDDFFRAIDDMKYS